MNKSFVIDEQASNIPSDEVLSDESHQLNAHIDINNSDIYFEFSSREAMREFALSLLYECEFGAGEVELYPLVLNGKKQIVNGARLTENSSRVFIWYPKSEHT